jgi:hypothetical protein
MLDREVTSLDDPPTLPENRLAESSMANFVFKKQCSSEVTLSLWMLEGIADRGESI